MQFIKSFRFKPIVLSACSIVTGLSRHRFFNRESEVKSLVHQVTENHPGLILVTGPPDSGKTSVLKKVMEESKSSCRWFHMDMRQPGNSWDDIPSIYTSLYMAFAIGRNNTMSIRALEFTADILEWFTFKIKLWWNKDKPPKTELDVKKLLLTVEKKMIRKKRSWHPGKRYTPVLFLDEASHMYGKLDKTEEGKNILECFMEFIHRNTKQNENFHVILASSSSMFVRRIMKDSLSRSSVIVIGDLSKEHAQEYWQWLEKEEGKSCSVQFDKVFEKVGGHMFDLRRVFMALEPEEELSQMIAVAQTNLTSLIVPTPSKNPEKPELGWTKEQGEEVVNGIRLHGYMEVRPLREKHGDDMIDEMVKEHVVCYRPGPVWKDDLNLPENVEFPIITAPTPLHLWVLKEKFKEN